jgi:hypothetical protein
MGGERALEAPLVEYAVVVDVPEIEREIDRGETMLLWSLLE